MLNSGLSDDGSNSSEHSKTQYSENGSDQSPYSGRVSSCCKETSLLFSDVRVLSYNTKGEKAISFWDDCISCKLEG